jgi:hypothetical protein
VPPTLRSLLCLAFFVSLAAPGSAAVKFYNSDRDNGEPGDAVRDSVDPVSTDPSPDILQGFHRITDDGLGTVTLNETLVTNDDTTDVGPEQLTGIFGPGSFVFILQGNTTTLSAAAISNTSNIGSHGPSGTAPGESAEWGVLSGWTITGADFCVSSPVTICNQANFTHGATVPSILPSTTYDLGTWSFDAVGDLEAAAYVHRTTNGGLTNVRYTIQGRFQGASLPALPLVGFGALLVGLLTVGTRALLGSRK